MVKSRQFSGYYHQIRHVCQFVSAEAELAGLDKKARFQIELACDEASTNIIEHAYGGEGKGDFEVSCEVVGQAFRIIMRDHGRPFDPDPIPVKEINETIQPHQMSIGGLGIQFIKKLMDELYYQFDEIGNKITMVKKIPQAVTAPLKHEVVDQAIDLVTITGRLDHQLSPALDSLLSSLVSAELPILIIDLNKTDYVNSGGLRVLVAVWRRAREKGGDLVLSGLHDEVAETFAMVGFNKILKVYDSAESAITALSSSK